MDSNLYEASDVRDRHPLLRLLVSFPIACFTCALLTDGAYARTANFIWADFSAWLLAVGMAGGVLAGIAGVVAWVANRRTMRRAWVVALGGLVTLVIALANNFVHSRDAWTSVVPAGLALSAANVIVMLATAWLAAGRIQRRTAALSASGIRQ